MCLRTVSSLSLGHTALKCACTPLLFVHELLTVVDSKPYFYQRVKYMPVLNDQSIVSMVSVLVLCIVCMYVCMCVCMYKFYDCLLNAGEIPLVVAQLLNC